MKRTTNGMERRKVANPHPVKGPNPGPYGSRAAQPPPTKNHGSWWTAKDFRAALEEREKDSWGPMGSTHISSLTIGPNETRNNRAPKSAFAPIPKGPSEIE